MIATASDQTITEQVSKKCFSESNLHGEQHTEGRYQNMFFQQNCNEIDFCDTIGEILWRTGVELMHFLNRGILGIQLADVMFTSEHWWGLLESVQVSDVLSYVC